MKNGYVTLLSMLIVSAISVAIATSLLLLGLGASRTSYAAAESAQARAYANACAEEGLERIRLLTSFTGTGALTLPSGSCVYTVTSQGGQNRTVTAIGTKAAIVRKTKVVVTQITPRITVSTWQEVADF